MVIIKESPSSRQPLTDIETPLRAPLQKQVFLDRYARKDPQGMPVEHLAKEMRLPIGKG